MDLRAVEGRVLKIAPWLLAASVLGHFVLVLTQTKMTMIDLMVYRNASPELFTSHLYDWHLSEYSDQFALPFTYPPFAALVFYPLSLLPWGLVRWLWQILSVACLWWLVRGSMRLLATDTGSGSDTDTGSDTGSADAPRWQQRAMLWTALALWIEPVRTTLNYGQINLLLAALLLVAMASKRSVLSGFLVGLTAGVKLTPASTGIYFLAKRRWAAAVWSAVAFALTIGVPYLIAPSESTQYWFHLLGDASRIGPVGSAINQSLRGALSRTVGYDVGSGPLWLIAVLISATLMVWAIRSALRARDVLGAMLAVQVFSLLASPISWSHHWVWMVPALLWAIYGKAAGRPIVTASAVLWILATGSFLISFLLKEQPTIWTISRPWYLASLGWAYPACGLLTLVAIAVGLQVRATVNAEVTQVATVGANMH